MYMVDTFVHAKLAGLDALVETLHLAVRGDQGFALSIGDPNWTTDGGFATVSYDALKLKGKTIAPYVQTEIYRTRPDNGDMVRETLRSWSGGVAARISPQLMLKAEYLWFAYVLPNAATAGSLRLDVNGAQLSAVVTF